MVELEGEHSKVEIDPVAVLPEYKNKRIGSQLMDKALVWCKKKRYKTVRAVVSVKAGDRLHNFFEKKDFN